MSASSEAVSSNDQTSKSINWYSFSTNNFIRAFASFDTTTIKIIYRLVGTGSSSPFKDLKIFYCGELIYSPHDHLKNMSLEKIIGDTSKVKYAFIINKKLKDISVIESKYEKFILDEMYFIIYNNYVCKLLEYKNGKIVNKENGILQLVEKKQDSKSCLSWNPEELRIKN